MSYSKLAVIDFDGTLVHSPHKEATVDGVTVLKVYDRWLREQKLPPRKWTGWWGRKETLLPPIFGRYEGDRLVYPQESLNQEMAAKVREFHEDPEVLSVLMTGRHNGMRKDQRHICELILESYGLNFDRYYYLEGFMPTLRWKCGTIDKILDEFPTIQKVVMYEDRPDHVSEFCDFLKLRRREGHIQDFKVERIYAPDPSYDE